MKKLFIPFSLFLFLLSQGCVDNHYDGDIDKNVQLAGNGLSAPIGETSKFTLNDLIGEDDNLKIDGDSAYYISETSNSTAEFPTLEPFNIDNGLNPDIDPEPLNVKSDLKEAVDLHIHWAGHLDTVFVGDTVEIKPEDIKVPKEVLYIDTAYFEDVRYATLTFAVNLFDKILDSDSFDLKLRNLRGELPKMLMLSKDKSSIGNCIARTEDGKAVSVTNYGFVIDSTDTRNGEFILRFPIYGIYGRDYFEIHKDIDKETGDSTGILNIINNGFSFDGKAVVWAELQGGFDENGNSTSLLAYPTISTDFVIEDLDIFHVFGEVEASAEENFDIEIGSMPDFLSDEGVTLDFYPYIKLHATNPMGVPVKASLSIMPQTESGEPETVKAEINMQAAKYNSDTQRMDEEQCHFYLSDNEPEGLNAADSTVLLNDTTYKWIPVELSNLLENGVPESLDVAIIAKSDTTGEHEIVLSSDSNNVHVDCFMTVPMAFGKNLLINYSDVITGLDDVFQDFSLDSAIINITDSTTLPLDLTISLWGMEEVSESDYTAHKNEIGNDGEPLYMEDEDEDEDEDGNEIKDVHYYKVLDGIDIAVLGGEGNSGTIKGCDDSSLNPTPAVGKIIASLKALDPDDLKKMSAIRYKLSGKPANTSNATGAVGTLRSTQYLKLKMTATISGVSVDLDSL